MRFFLFCLKWAMEFNITLTSIFEYFHHPAETKRDTKNTIPTVLLLTSFCFQIMHKHYVLTKSIEKPKEKNKQISLSLFLIFESLWHALHSIRHLFALIPSSLALSLIVAMYQFVLSPFFFSSCMLFYLKFIAWVYTKVFIYVFKIRYFQH